MTQRYGVPVKCGMCKRWLMPWNQRRFERKVVHSNIDHVFYVRIHTCPDCLMEQAL